MLYCYCYYCHALVWYEDHGASTKYFAAALQENCAEADRIQGTRALSAWGVFVPSNKRSKIHKIKPLIIFNSYIKLSSAIMYGFGCCKWVTACFGPK